MKGETAAHAGFHSANAAMTQTEDHMAEAPIGALKNLATATASDRVVIAALTQANARHVKQLEETSSELRELRALHHQEWRDMRDPRNLNATAKKLLLDSWLQGGQDSHKPLLQHSQSWPQNRGNSS
jgi:histidine ammonia-lyase